MAGRSFQRLSLGIAPSNAGWLFRRNHSLSQHALRDNKTNKQTTVMWSVQKDLNQRFRICVESVTVFISNE